MKIRLSLLFLLGAFLQYVAFAKTNPSFEVSHYDVSISPNIKDRSFSGKTTIQVKAISEGTEELRFPINKLSIEWVIVGGGEALFKVEKEELTIKLPKRLQANESAEAKISYTGGPAPGINFGQNYFYTAYFTCHWMICLEEPFPKASITLRIKVPESYRTVASGKLLRETLSSEKTKESIWEQKRPYSTYLFGFATGEFSEAETKSGSTTLRYLGSNELPEVLKAKFAPTSKMLRFFEGKSGVPFPHDAYTQVLVPGEVAQENSSYSLIGTDFLDPILSNPQEDWVIAHELSHQWWGNLVTCKSWQHGWLNEGITVFMVAAYKEHRWGKAAYDKEMQLARKRYQKAIDAGFDVPLTYSKDYPSLSMQRAIMYSKGALFLDSLRNLIGENAFWKGLKLFTQKYAAGSVESKDFQTAMERASKKDLSGIFKKWVYE
jgi:aminopeptidase N